MKIKLILRQFSTQINKKKRIAFKHTFQLSSSLWQFLLHCSVMDVVKCSLWNDGPTRPHLYNLCASWNYFEMWQLFLKYPAQYYHLFKPDSWRHIAINCLKSHITCILKASNYYNVNWTFNYIRVWWRVHFHAVSSR